MKTTWKGLLAGTAALAIAACTPADSGAEAEADGADTAEAPEAAEDDAMMAAEGDMAEAPEAGAEAAAEGEEPEREGHGNPAGPLTADE